MLYDYGSRVVVDDKNKKELSHHTHTPWSYVYTAEAHQSSAGGVF